jgi:glycosyltransferase involved in cell wall biosynthesis
MPLQSPVAVNASILGPAPSGLGQYALGLVRSLDPLREGLVVYTSCSEGLSGLRATVRRTSSLTRPDRGVRGYVARLLWCQTALRARMAIERPGVLFNTLPEGVLRCRVPQITVVHDLIPLAFPRDYPRQQFYFRRLVPAILRESRAVIAISEATRREVIRAYGLRPERIRAIPIGYAAAEFVPVGPATDDGGVPYVLNVGNLLPHKNLPRLIEAVARVARQCPVRLVIAGSGTPGRLAELRRLGENAGSLLELMPYVSQRALPALYRGASLVAMPSLAEGFGLPPLEAMACGTPVVVGNTSAMPEVVGDAGLLINPEDTGTISDAILRLLTQEPLRKELIARDLARAAAFSWERIAPQVLAVLDEVAASWIRRSDDISGTGKT